jgi:hypothetical protein
MTVKKHPATLQIKRDTEHLSDRSLVLCTTIYYVVLQYVWSFEGERDRSLQDLSLNPHSHPDLPHANRNSKDEACEACSGYQQHA